MRKARLLVLRGGAIGDFIVTLPVLQELRQRWPDGHIEVIGYPHVARLAEWSGLVNHVRSLDEARIARYFVEDAPIRDNDQAYFASFDVVISFLHDPLNALYNNLKRCGVQVLIVQSPLITDTHAADHLMAVLPSLAIYSDFATPQLTVPAAHRTQAEPPWVALHPGSGGKKKCWPLASFVTIAEQIKAHTSCEPVWITGDVEREYEPALDLTLAGYRRLHQLPLTELAAKLATARAYLGNDAGITHLAAAVGVPTIALFGPTASSQWAPRGPLVDIIISPTGAMNDIPTDTVWSALARLLPKRTPIA